MRVRDGGRVNPKPYPLNPKKVTKCEQLDVSGGGCGSGSGWGTGEGSGAGLCVCVCVFFLFLVFFEGG